MNDLDHDSAPDSGHVFIVMWCSEGLEYVGDVTQDSKDRVWARLRDQDYRSQIPNLMHLELRARYNIQRFYEIYLVNATEDVTADDIREMFVADPQTAAELIRARGTRIFGEPMGSQRTVIR